MMTQCMPENKNVFFTIYELAKKQDILQLNNLKNAGFDINITIRDFSPMGMLAKEGNQLAVTLLIEHFNADKYDAILCAAWGTQFALLDYLMQDESPNNMDKCVILILRGFLRNDDSQNIILNYFSNHPHFHTFNSQQKESLQKIVYQEMASKYLVDKSNAVHGQISYTQIKNWIDSHNLNYLTFNQTIQKVSRFFNCTVSHSFNFSQAQAWMMPDLHFWFLIGIEKYREGSCTLEIFIKISAYHFKIVERDMLFLFKTHLDIVPKLLRNHSINNAEKIYHRMDNRIKRFFFSTFPELNTEKENDNSDVETLNNKIQIANQKYIRRITF